MRRPNYAALRRFIENPIYVVRMPMVKLPPSRALTPLFAVPGSRRKARGDWLALIPESHEGYELGAGRGDPRDGQQQCPHWFSVSKVQIISSGFVELVGPCVDHRVAVDVVHGGRCGRPGCGAGPSVRAWKRSPGSGSAKSRESELERRRPAGCCGEPHFVSLEMWAE